METLIIRPKRKVELEKLLKIIKEMDIDSSRVTEEKMIDLGMYELLKKGSRAKVSEKTIKKILQ